MYHDDFHNSDIVAYESMRQIERTANNRSSAQIVADYSDKKWHFKEKLSCLGIFATDDSTLGFLIHSSEELIVNNLGSDNWYAKRENGQIYRFNINTAMEDPTNLHWFSFKGFVLNSSDELPFVFTLIMIREWVL